MAAHDEVAMMLDGHLPTAKDAETRISLFLVWGVLLALASPPSVRSESQTHATIGGILLVQGDLRPLAAVAISLCDPTGGIVAEAITADDGSFVFPPLLEGQYQIRVSLPGFQDYSETVVLSRGQQFRSTVVLRLKELRETVEVVGQAADNVPTTAGSAETLNPRVVDIEPVKGDNYQALLPLVPGVVRGPDGRINVKGANPIQSGLMVGSSNAADPSTGNPGFELPVDAIESVDVLPNPYNAEYGRFSSGVTQIQTRKGQSRWEFLVNNFLPRYKWRDGTIMGVEHYTPRLSVSGPLIRNRLFLSQSFQYRLIRTPVPSQPVLQRDQSLESFDSFTRLDADISERHQLQATFAVFPRKLDFVNLNTFNPKEVTANIHNRGYQTGFQETMIFGPSQILETTFTYRSYDTDVFGQGFQPMRLYPEGNRGNYFNRQARCTTTIQWVETLTKLASAASGQHLIKAGIDLMSSKFRGTSNAGTVQIYRADSTLNTKIEYSGASRQTLRATDVTGFLQDHWRINDRWALELGLRLDHDAVPSRVNFAPRAGLVVSLLPEGRGIMRGGAGFFFEQTPLNVGVFEAYESQTISRFAADGRTLSEPPTHWRHHSSPNLKTPHSFIWNIEYDQRLSKTWLARLNHLRRYGRREYMIDPVTLDSGSEYFLDSHGRSRYWEVELTLRYSRGESFYMSWSYVRSRSEADLNNYDLFFGNLRSPIIVPNEYSLAPVDVPHRFLYRAVLPVPFKIAFSPIVEIRNGFPYSDVDAYQQFVGPRNRAGRFPTLAALDVRVTRPFKFWKWKAEIGARIYHVLNSFTPRDVQTNIDAPDYGTFYNTIPRNWGFTLQFRK